MSRSYTHGTVARRLELRERSGQVLRRGHRHRVVADTALDTRSDPVRARVLRKWWVERALDRFGEGPDRSDSYSVFGISERDHRRLRELRRAYLRELRAMAASQRMERVMLASMQLVGLDARQERRDVALQGLVDFG